MKPYTTENLILVGVALLATALTYFGIRLWQSRHDDTDTPPEE